MKIIAYSGSPECADPSRGRRGYHPQGCAEKGGGGGRGSRRRPAGPCRRYAASGPRAPRCVPTRSSPATVAVIGGGATGTYAAIRLRDLGHSVVVVEAADRLFGHTHTYTDPCTGGNTHIGVAVWHELPIVRADLARLDVPAGEGDLLRPSGHGVEVRRLPHRQGGHRISLPFAMSAAPRRAAQPVSVAGITARPAGPRPG